MGSTRRSFTAEYKANAVSLVIDDGRAIAEVARSIGVHEMTLGKWVKKTRDEGNGESDRRRRVNVEADVDQGKKAHRRELSLSSSTSRRLPGPRLAPPGVTAWSLVALPGSDAAKGP